MIGVPELEFSGSHKGGMKGEVKTGKGVGEGTGPKTGGRIREKGVGGQGLKALEKLCSWYPYDLGTLEWPFKWSATGVTAMV